jgi:hypothetical protein
VTGYVCTNCGGTAVKVREARPSVDDRYALGFCAGCSGSGQKRNERQLCRSDLWRPEILQERKRAEAERELLRHVTGPQESHKTRAGLLVPPAPITDEEEKEARAILARQESMWGG